MIQEVECFFHDPIPAGQCLMCRSTGRVLTCKTCGAARPVSMLEEFKQDDCVTGHVKLPAEIAEQLDESYKLNIQKWKAEHSWKQDITKSTS